LSRVNLLVGPNDSGKTSILEAVAAFSRPLDLRVWLDATWRREILQPDEPVSQKLEWMFPHETTSINGSFIQVRISKGTYHSTKRSEVRTDQLGM